MLRRATFTAFIKDSVQLRDQMPIHRAGASFACCNYSSQARNVFIDYSNDGSTWTTLGLHVKAGTVTSGVTVQPRGIVVGSFWLPEDALNAKFIRVRLDDTADGDGVFVQIDTSAPIPDYPLQSWS